MSDTRHEQLTRWHVDMFPWREYDSYVYQRYDVMTKKTIFGVFLISSGISMPASTKIVTALSAYRWTEIWLCRHIDTGVNT